MTLTAVREAFVTRKAVIPALSIVLAGMLVIYHGVDHLVGQVSLIIPIVLAIILWGETYSEAEIAAVRLLQAVGGLSTVFVVCRYPLIPPSPTIHHSALFAALFWLVWLVCVVCGVLGMRRPGLMLLPVGYLTWSLKFSPLVTGLSPPGPLDILPLTEVGICLGSGLALIRVSRLWLAPRLPSLFGPDPESGHRPLDDFGQLMVMLALAVHLSNYFWSFVAKMTLAGPPLAWLMHNDSSYFFLAALQTHRVAFYAFPQLVSLVHFCLTKGFVFTNIMVLTVQAMALVALFFPKKLLIALLLAFDVMHLAFLVLGGLYFWPWIFLNLVLGAVVARSDFHKTSLTLKVIGTCLIVLAPILISVARLGWYDTGANSNIFVQAEDQKGQRYFVSTNMFTFYSYPIAHMDYGMPGAKTAIATGSPYGGGPTYRELVAGHACDAAALLAIRHGTPLEPALLRYLVGYHKIMVKLQDTVGHYPYSLNLYHFYEPPAFGREFSRLDKHQVKAYIVRRESSCLSFENGAPKEKLISTAEEHVDVK